MEFCIELMQNWVPLEGDLSQPFHLVYHPRKGTVTKNSRPLMSPTVTGWGHPGQEFSQNAD